MELVNEKHTFFDAGEKKTGYPSIDKEHLEGTNFFERHPIIPSMSFSNLLDLMFVIQGKHMLVDSLELEVDTNEFKKDGKLYASAFVEMGLKQSDIVAVSMPNYYQAIPVFKATNMLGAITTYLNPYASKEELIEYLNKYSCPILVTMERNDIKEIMDKTQVKYVVTMSQENINSRDFGIKTKFTSDNDRIIDLHGIKNMPKNRIPLDLNSGKKDALILYTSGSTGKSKSLLFTNENLIASCIYLKNSTHVPNPTPEDSKWMNAVPFMYPYGFGASVLQTMLSGREVILSPNLSGENISYFYDKKPNLVFGSPAHLELTKRNLPEDQDLTGLKVYVSGGDFLSVSQSRDAIEFFKKHNADVAIANSSGTGETLGCSTNAMNVPYRPETVGQLVVGPDYVIINPETGKEVKYGEPGVLCTSGKHVFKGYYGDEELTEESMMVYNGKKYYMTGNIGYLDRNRYFTLVGRASRFFIVYTLNKVYCELVQNVLSKIDIVDSVAVVPKPNKEMLFESKAYIVLKEGVAPSEEIEKYIIDKSKETYIDENGNSVTLKDYEVPCSVTFVRELPRTMADKIDYEGMRILAEKEYNDEEKGIARKRTMY